jgi:hypothetical protein
MKQCKNKCECGCDKRHYILSERDLKELANTHPDELQGGGFIDWVKKKAVPFAKNIFSKTSKKNQKPTYRVKKDEDTIKYPENVFIWYGGQFDDTGEPFYPETIAHYEDMAMAVHKNIPKGDTYQNYMWELDKDYDNNDDLIGRVSNFRNDIMNY